jgi:hypothetical protein
MAETNIPQADVPTAIHSATIAPLPKPSQAAMARGHGARKNAVATTSTADNAALKQKIMASTARNHAAMHMTEII